MLSWAGSCIKGSNCLLGRVNECSYLAHQLVNTNRIILHLLTLNTRNFMVFTKHSPQ